MCVYELFSFCGCCRAWRNRFSWRRLCLCGISAAVSKDASHRQHFTARNEIGACGCDWRNFVSTLRRVKTLVWCLQSQSKEIMATAAGPQPRPSTPSVSLPDLNHDHPRPVFAAGPQPRPSTPSVRCRTSTTTIQAQCSLPDLNHDHPRPVFAAGPQPRPSTPSVRCRTSTAGENAKRYDK